MNHAVRKTAGVTFFVLKVTVFVFITFSVMAFLSEIAVRMRMQLAQPFKGVAVIALGVVSALPSAWAIDRLKQRTLRAPDDFECDEVNEDIEVTTPPAKLRCSGGFSNSQMRVADSQAGYPLSLHSQQTLVQASVVPDSKC